MFDKDFVMIKSVESKNVKKEIEALSFCEFDLETNGGNHDKDKIIEIGLVKIENLKIVDEKHYLIQPEIKIPDFIQKLTQIGPKEVEHAKLIENVIDEILIFMGNSVLVAHNTSFDIPFFNSVLKRLGKKELVNKSLCTNLMTKHLIPNLLNSNLNYMSKIFGIKHKQAHRALDDAKATAELLINYINIFLDKGITKINHLYYPRNKYELDLINIKSTDKKTKLTKSLQSFNSPFLITFKGDNGIILLALPCKHSENEIKFIKEYASKLPWKTISIKLYGSLLECLVHLNNHFTKIENNLRNEISNFLWKEHLSSYKVPDNSITGKEDTLDKNMLEVSGRDIGDFVIINHLVPEQYIVYPILSLHQKSCLIFRYPAHQKKLIQFLRSRSAKMQAGKIKKTPFAPQLRKFLTHYIINLKETNDHALIFTKKQIQKNESEFLEMAKKFCDDSVRKYNYPREYV